MARLGRSQPFTPHFRNNFVYAAAPGGTFLPFWAIDSNQIMSDLRKNVASQVVTFSLVNATTGAALTGASVTTKVTLDGTQSGSAGTLTELGTGQYKYVPTQAETNGASVGLGFTATNAVPVNIHCFTIGQDPALSTFDVNVTKLLGTAWLTPGVAGTPDVNTKLIGGQTVTAGSGVTFPSSVASPTNITAGVITTVTTVTNQLTAAAIATGVWQDATAGDFTTASSIGKSLFTGAVPGTAGGIFISGSNTATTVATFTVSGATAFTGNVAMSDGLTLSKSTLNGHAFQATGNGTGAGFRILGGTTGRGIFISGGGTSGEGIGIATTSGDGIVVAATAGHGLNLTASGTSKHGFFATGGSAGTSDGIKAVAGTGGVDIRGAITGDITGTLSTLTTYTGNTPQTGDSYARLGAAGAGLTALGDTRIANLDASVTSRMASYSQPTGFLAATFPTTVASTTNITGGTITTVTNLTNAPTSGDLTATMKTSVTTAATAATPTLNATQTFSNTGTWTGNLVGTVSTVTTLTNLPAITTNWLTATGIAADAITAAKVATDVGTEIGTAVWVTGTRTLTSGSPTALENAAAVWNLDYGTNPPASPSYGEFVLAISGGGSSGSGTGAYAITVTVNDGSTALQNVNVRAVEGINAFTALTDASGQVSFSLDAATYTLTLTKDGYSYTPTSKTVTGSHTGTLNAIHSMSLITAPTATGTQSACSIYTYDEHGALKAGVVINFRVLNPPGAGSYNTAVISATSNVSGLLTINLPQNTACEAQRGDGDWVTFTTDSDSATALPEILGSDY